MANQGANVGWWINDGRQRPSSINVKAKYAYTVSVCVCVPDVRSARADNECYYAQPVTAYHPHCLIYLVIY